MIKCKIEDLITAEAVIVKLKKLSEEQKLKFRTNQKFKRVWLGVGPELEEFNLIKNNFLVKNGKVQPQTEEDKALDKKIYVITDKTKRTEWLEIFNDISSLEVELPNVFPFEEEDLINLTELDLHDCLALGPFYKEPKDSEEIKERTSIKERLEKKTKKG